jgi:hypothetical protein
MHMKGEASHAQDQIISGDHGAALFAVIAAADQNGLVANTVVFLVPPASSASTAAKSQLASERREDRLAACGCKGARR